MFREKRDGEIDFFIREVSEEVVGGRKADSVFGAFLF